MAKVLIFTPTYEGKEYCRERFVENLNKILKHYPLADHVFIDNSATPSYAAHLASLGLDVLRVARGNNSRESLTRAQNTARKIAIEGGYDYMLSLESDIFPPVDVVAKLVATAKPVIGCVYLIGDDKKGVRIPCVTLREYNQTLGAWGTRLLKFEELAEYRNRGIKEVASCGMGCTLIHRDVFTKVPFMYDPRFLGHSDIYFFNSLHRLNTTGFVHTDIYCDHQNSNWNHVVDR